MYEQVAVKGKFQRFSDRYGWKGWLTILFYPVLTLVTTPIRLVQTLWNCRVLANGKWGDYNHFNPRSGLNSLFYWTQAENLYRFGRCGTSPYIGVGKYFLGKWWHLSLVSTYAYWKGGCIVPLLGMFGWWIGHVLWLGQAGASVGWVLIVMALSLFCTTFYSNSFVMQNYNAMGWLFMPIGLYGSASGNWELAAFAWLGASFGSFTVVLLAAVLSIVSALQAWSLMPVATLIPAGLKLATHFWPFLQDGNAWQSIRDTAKGIGLSRRKARYVRRNTRFGLERYYYLGIYGQFVVCYWIFYGTLPLLLIVALTIWITNFRIARFADEQSMRMLILSVATAELLQGMTNGLGLLISFWILASPIPLLGGVPGNKLATVPVYGPFEVKTILKDMESFLLPASRGKQRVLMAFDNPHGDYERLFDGYRALLEAVLHVASKMCIHFIPDWYGVFELNYEGAPDFWGRDVEYVEKQMEDWDADYAVVYQKSGTELESKWRKYGFIPLSHFSWAKYQKSFEPLQPYSGATPDWWLLEKEKRVQSLERVARKFSDTSPIVQTRGKDRA